MVLYDKVFIHPPNRMGKGGVSSVKETPTDTKYVTNYIREISVRQDQVFAFASPPLSLSLPLHRKMNRWN